MLNLRSIKLALVAATLAVAWTSAQSAHATPTCSLGGGLLTISMTENHDDVTLQAYDSGSILVFTPGKILDCGATKTTTGVDTILIDDTSDDSSTAAGYDGATTVRIAEPGNFAPGKTPESSGSSEIEFFVDMKGGADTLVTGGLKPQNIFLGNGGLNWNLDDDADILGMPFSHVLLAGSPARDLLIARGGQGTGAPLSTAKSLQISGDTGDDYVSGSDIAGGDVIVGGAGNDNIEGAGGTDTIEGGPDDDIMSGGSGTDTVRFEGSQDTTVDLSLAGPQDTGHGQDLLVQVENVQGTAAADHLIGDAGPNELDGGGGDDVLDGRGGADELRGGTGTDTVSYADAPAGVTIDLSRGDQVTDADRIYFVENLIGSPFGDALTGNDVGNRVVGGAGADVIASGFGDDVIEVRDGEGDQVSCGGGSPGSTGVDAVVSDRRSLDAIAADCESVDALPEPVQPDQPDQPTDPGPGTDTPDTALSFTLGGASRQRLLRQKAVHVKVTCPQEACTTVATTTGRLRLRPLTTSIAAGSARTLKLRLTRRQLGVVRKAIAAGRRPSLTVTVRARDGAGNVVSRAKRVRAVR